MTLASPLVILLSGFVGLSGVGVSSFVMLRLNARQRHFRDRLARVAGPHFRRRAEEPRSVVRQGNIFSAMHVVARVMVVFGIDPEQHDQYPVYWWLVLILALVAARALCGLASAVLGLWAYLLLLPAWVWFSRSFFRWVERRRSDSLLRQFPDALATIVRSVRAGIPVGEAIRLLGRDSPMPTAAEFKTMGDQIAMGVPLGEALTKLGSRTMLAEYRFFATALSLQAQTGGGLAETLDNLADVIRKRVAAKNRGRALASEVNTTAGILCVMPLFTGLVLWVLNPAYISVLFENPDGQRVLAGAAFLLGSGMGMMRFLIRRALS